MHGTLRCPFDSALRDVAWCIPSALHSRVKNVVFLDRHATQLKTKVEVWFWLRLVKMNKDENNRAFKRAKEYTHVL